MSDYYQQARSIEARLFPHKKISLGDLRQISDSVFDVNGVEINFSSQTVDTINHQIGTSKTQLSMVRNASGDVGEMNFRNFLSDATTFTNNKDVIIVASPETRSVVNVIIPKYEFITANQFFDFAAMFMDEAGYEFKKIEFIGDGRFDVMVYMQSLTPTIKQFAPGEDTITDGAYLHWTGDQIELGNVFTRLVCSNGAVATVNKHQSTLKAFNANEVRRIIELGKSRGLAEVGYQNYQNKALEAMSTQCSLAELQGLTAGLVSQRVGLDREMVDSILHTSNYEAHFESRGIDVKKQAKMIKTNLSAWDVFNILTAFATHTQLLQSESGKRSAVLRLANHFLQAERHIKNYIEY